jgi:hypothetical protein
VFKVDRHSNSTRGSGTVILDADNSNIMALLAYHILERLVKDLKIRNPRTKLLEPVITDAKIASAVASLARMS